MTQAPPLKFKICLVGEHEVGKTCLIKRYVFNEFSDSYLKTIGTRVTKKQMMVKHPDIKENIPVHLMIWDIVGRKGIRGLLQQAYFVGAQGILAVCDNTREDTLSGLDEWIKGVPDTGREIPTVFLGNKCDLEEQHISINEIRSFASGFESPGAYLSSAKTGFNVDTAFDKLSIEVLKGVL
jgi:small GTP-binding protein